jgi:hypothetical protein
MGGYFRLKQFVCREEKVNIKSYNVKTEDGGIYMGEIGDI